MRLLGYQISTLKNIPSHFMWYFFLVGDFRNRAWINDFFNDDFAIIAERIGDKAAIVKQQNQLEQEFHDMISCATQLSDLLESLQRQEPGLLILNKHPNELRAWDLKPDDKVIYIPFSVLERAYTSPNELLTDIVSFAKNKDKALLRKTSRLGRTMRRIQPSVSLNLGIIALNFDF